MESHPGYVGGLFASGRVGETTTIEDAFTDPKMFELFAGEFLIRCVRNGDYVDPRDVMAHMQPSPWRDYTMSVLGEVCIR